MHWDSNKMGSNLQITKDGTCVTNMAQDYSFANIRSIETFELNSGNHEWAVRIDGLHSVDQYISIVCLCFLNSNLKSQKLLRSCKLNVSAHAFDNCFLRVCVQVN